MASNMPVKLLLRDASSISLNARFEKLPKNQPQETQQNARRQERIQNQQSSAKNRRLAAQMANRPSVQRALGSTQDLTSPPRPPRRGGLRGFGSLRGRGAAVRGRGAAAIGGGMRSVAPSFQGNRALQQSRQPNSVKSRLTLRGAARGVFARGVRARGGAARGGAARGGAARGGEALGRLGVRGATGAATRGWRGSARSHGAGDLRRGTFDRNTRGAIVRGASGRGAMTRRTAGRGGPSRGTGRGRGASRGRGSERVFTNSLRGAGGRGARGMARGSNRGRGGRGSFNKSSLDNELDEYMAGANIDDQLLM
ncbi:chromatin target of PRMT1 protein-like isoform X2 [Watersipora subatra]|uniref:chromatin target of PRMT1 protein-like isoform X2 n=1 Tax=Watersipora subatra TaxID=2589382 RepID=UPI00355B7A30